MTAQIEDVFQIDGQEYSLLGLKGKGLFNADDYGFFPESMHTACWRGYYCAYDVVDGQLFLTELTIRDAFDRYPPISGVEATPDTDGRHARPGQVTYESLREHMSFSGVLRLGKGFHDERYVHMGFQDCDAYDTVLDLRFDKGILVSTTDRSDDLGYAPDRETPRGSGPDWIAERFSLDIDE
jgi:hypothetical protein